LSAMTDYNVGVMLCFYRVIDKETRVRVNVCRPNHGK